jgi:hypothetical protein
MINKMILLILSLFLFSLESFAQVPQAFMYQGQILQNGVTPLEANSVAFTVKILSPGPETCVLYQEQHFVNMSGSNGVFSLSIGNGVRSGSNYEDTSSLLNVFSNKAPLTGLSTCVSGSSYNPAGTATRKIRVSYNDGTTTVTLNQDHHLQATPFSWYADSLQGMTPTDFIQVNPVQNVTQSNLEAVFGGTGYTGLLSLLAGSSNLYMRKDANGAHLPNFAATPAGVTAGSVWYDSSAQQMKFYDGAAVQVVGGAGVGTGTVTAVTAGSGLTGGTITTSGTIDVATGGITSDHILDGTVADADLASGIDASKITTGTLPTSVVPPDPTKLSLSGGTMTGTIDMAGQQILGTGHVTMSPTSTITIGQYTNAQQTVLVASLTSVNAGAVWYNSDMTTMMYWDGAAAQTITNASTGGGDITDVVAGSGLTGGATTGSATLGIATGGVTSTHILDGTIATADMADASVTDAKITAMAATKLTGTVPNANLPIGTATAQLFTIDQVPHCASNQKLEMSNGPVYVFTCVADTDSGGDITSVTTTAPLSGGGTSGDVALTLDIDNSSIGVNGSSQLEVKDAGITNAKIVGMTADKITSAAGKYFSYMPAGTECGNDEILKWDATNDRWVCAAETNPVTSVFSRTGAVTAQSGDYTATQITNTPAGNIAATTAQAAITELDTEKVAKTGDTMTGALTFNAQAPVRFADSDSSNYVSFQAPTTVASNVTFTLPGADGTSGQVLVTDGLGVLSWSTAAVGDITGVTAGSGLTGGGTSGDVSVSVATGGITSTHIFDGTIATADLADASVTDAKIAAVGVEKIASGSGNFFLYKPDNTSCATGEVLKWNNSRWECGTDNDTGDITAVNTTAPLSGGATSGAISLTLNYDNSTIGINGSSQIEVKDAGVSTAKIVDGAVTNAKITSMSVDKITSAATQYFSYMPAGTECASGEVLKWEAVNDRWECGTDTDTQLITSVFTRTGAITAQAGDYTAAQITNTPSGNIAATTAQAAITELDSEKLAKAGDTMTGHLVMNAQSEVRFADSDSSNYISLRSPSSVASNITFTLPGADGTSGQVLVTDGSGVLSWSTAAVGDITGVTAGSGLTGGGTSGDVSVAVATGGITSSHIFDGTIATADLADSSVTDAKIAAVGVEKIASGSGNFFLYKPDNTSCATGEVLKWNNSRWECGTDNDTGDITAVNTTAPLSGGAASGAISLTLNYDNSTIGINGSSQIEVKDGAVSTAKIVDGAVTNAKITSMSVDKITSGATQYFSYMPAGTECANGEVLKWDATNDRWECGADADTQLITSVFTRTGAITAQAGDYTAAQITNTPAGNIAATTAQAAITELDSEKLAKAGDAMTGALTLNAQSPIRFADSDSSNYVSFQAPTTVASNVTFTLPGTDGTSGQVLVTDGLGVLSWSTAAVGDITGVTAGSGLTGGGTSGDVSVAVATGGITSAHIFDGTIATADLADSSVTDAKIVGVGVEKIASSSGNFFLYKPDNTACSTGEVLKWNNSRWECGTDNDTGDITSVVAGTGLTGGATTGAATLNVDVGTGPAQFSTNDAVPHCTSTQKLEMSSGPVYSWTCTTDLDSGGDITAVTTTAPLSGGGTSGAVALTIAYDDSTVGINGSSQLEVKDGGITNAKIVGMTADKVTSAAGKYLSYMPSGTECADGEVLKWDATNDRWECGTDIDTNTDAITSVFTRTGAISAQAGDYNATQITNTPAGNIAATTAQAAITELDSEKLAKAGDAMTGSLTMNAQNSVRFADSDSSNYVALKSPATVASNVTFTLPGADGTSGQVLVTDGSGVLSWSTAAVGDITGVTAGSGLTGGGTSGDISVSVPTGGITSTHILDGTIATADLADASVTDAKIAAVGVEKIASGSGNFFLYKPDNTACATGEVLKWNNSRWECGTDIDTNTITSVFTRTGAITAQAGDYTATQITNTPAGNIAATTAQAAITELDSEKLAKAGDAMTGALTMNAQNSVRFADSDSSNYIALRSPATVTSNVTFTLPGVDGTSGQVLVTDGSGALSWSTAAVGDITGVTAGSGLTGGGTSGDVSVSVPTGGITSTHILDGTIATADLADASVTDAKIAAVGVDKITSAASKYFSYMPAGTECATGEVLKWDATNDRWECGTDNDSGDITSVVAGTGLTGGATTGAATLNVDVGTGPAQFSTNDAVPHCTSAQKLEMSSGPVYTWTCTTDLDSGGDITAVTTTAPLSGGGTSGAIALTIAYDNSTVGINGSNELEVKDGGITNAKIVGMTADKVTSAAGKYFSYMPSGTECADGEVLKWDATNDRWQCGTDTDTNTDAITSVFTRTGAITAQAGDYTATQITNTPAGNIAATTTQAAITELDSEKLAKAGDAMIGALTMNAQNSVRFADSDSSNYIGLRSPATVASNVTFTLPGVDGTSGQVLVTDGSGVLSWSTAAVGDITGVTAGSGLTGGGTSGDVSVSVPTGGITSTHILDGTIATADLADASVTDAKIAAVGVEKIASGSGNFFLYKPDNTACATGEVLKWNNSRWECGTDNDTGDITAVNTTAPLSGGATSGAISLTLNYDNSTIAVNGSSQIEVKDAGVSTAKIADGAVTNAKITSMSIDKITSAAGKYLSYMPSGTECADGEVLKWDATNDRWQCGTDIDTNTNIITSVFTRTGAITAQAGDYTATQITNTPTGNIAATTAQAAITELDTEKLAKAGDAMTGALTMNAQNSVRFADSDSSNYIALRSPATVASNVTFTLPGTDGTSGQVLVTDGSGALSWSTAAVGDITGVTAGSGLTGGGTSGDVSVSVPTDGITSTHILDGTIATADLADASVTDAKVVSVAIDKISSASGKYFSYMPSGTECATGEVLKWNASTDRWSCGTDNDTGDITGVTAGTGLTGGGTSGTPTLAVDIGTSGTQLATNDSVPHCLATQKLEMSAGPVYTWSCVTDANAGGDITAVTTTAPLSGGATSGAVALTINYDASTIDLNGSNQLSVKDGGITTTQLADSSVTNLKIAGVDVSKITSSAGNYFTYLPNNVACSNNQVLKWNSGASRWLCGTDSDTGDITAVTTTAPLTGGATSGAISLAISYDSATIGLNGSSQLEVRDDGVTTAKVIDGAITNAKITSVDVAKISSGAGSYFTYLPNNVACSNNQVLKWNTASLRWQCGTDNDTGDITAVIAGSGLTGGAASGSATLSVDTGTGPAQFSNNGAVPNCGSMEKLSMSAGPVYTWSCVADAVARDIEDADGNTSVKVEASANEDTIRFNTAGNERMTIDSSGFVGVGTAPGSDRMRVYGDIRLGTTLTTGCIKSADGSTVAGTCSSDRRLKKNIKPIANVAEKLSQLTPKSYQWRADEFPQRQYGEQVEVGVIAQEVEKLFPELVEIDEDGFYRVRFQQLPFYLLKGFSEQYREVSSLKKKVDTLEAENQELKHRLEAIEKALQIRK